MINKDINKALKLISKFKKRYYKKHSHCPACGSTSYSSTYVDYIVTVRNGEEGAEVDDSFADKNQVTCECGWQGIVHDLS